AVVFAASNLNNIAQPRRRIRLAKTVRAPVNNGAIGAQSQTVQVPGGDRHYVAQSGRNVCLPGAIATPGDNRTILTQAHCYTVAGGKSYDIAHVGGHRNFTVRREQIFVPCDRSVRSQTKGKLISGRDADYVAPTRPESILSVVAVTPRCYTS